MFRWPCVTAKRSYQKVGFVQPNRVNKDLILSVLKSTATKREAQNYLKKYGDESVRNHCLLTIRDLLSQKPKKLSRFAVTVKQLQMLGVKPMFVLHPQQDVETQSEVLDKCLRQSGLQTIFISEALTRAADGSFKSPVKYDSLQDLIPIIKPRIFDENRCVLTHVTDLPAMMETLVAQLDCRIDKVVVLNEFGGITSGERHDNAHVFINLSQEFNKLTQSLVKDLKKLETAMGEECSSQKLTTISSPAKIQRIITERQSHLEDLQIMNRVLSRLPPSATGLITDLDAASNLTKNNPLLYNVLTDRSLISSSLPRFKKDSLPRSSWYELPACDEPVGNSKDAALMTTVVKRGVNIKVFDYKTLTRTNSIGFPGAENEIDTASTSTKVDLKKLKHIIDESFGRTLNLKHYLDRINGRIASIIIIGDYEGLAILTYEGPEKESFPYLDKFAVMPHLKGSLGISDIIFNLMFQKYPDELVWRSRKDNVVNKWYFQRSIGVLDLAMDLGDKDIKPSIFKLFFHGNNDEQNLFGDEDRLKTYSKYVRDIQPSWNA
ncbi:LANO_0F06062g1_1 [Lachancea nothofagi CBS 11611]|uniref:Amino-acid acetyltransferase, mitochondrial n=1 Tax=Lachancea nothofagi CBS 11611 TaxID=1266666 RepID=A0A1G4K8F8_9SACH|nr:LANO_0F06062g1_1 [Lachancea nothofagi CBS 11611]